MLFLCFTYENYVPTIIMHGVTSDISEMASIHEKIEELYPSMYVLSMEIGNGYWDSLLMSIND